ncbi:ParB/RepB/Spo0J family partition protein [Oceanicoccus sagamiensis]|uniref:ParB-like N-terminal domain-containing protein n=1 Tax=Oceanicoccus sagamiensis TaxID=716816 RepID=A0A1X9N4E6_9GAMM|nr:ParB/RepB/Spo0J family partition protein [Oceanicoccus sagamiensis]ARN73020.1 hypothetical protein BST96_02200 [Oceanicoccus sagamiensis]
MGSVRKFLHQSKLPDREPHHSRLFIDLAENIHIHHREYRTVFSLDEYFEYADILATSTEDVRNFLEQNPDYAEQEFPTTIMIAGGKERQLKFLENSPSPNKSTYFANELAIELQDVYVTDEIHIHYRDFRIGLDRERFRAIAAGFAEAVEQLNEFESSESYEREYHPDRIIDNFNNKAEAGNVDTKIMGIKEIDLTNIKSVFFENKTWTRDQESINALKQTHKKSGKFTPIIVSTEKDGTHLIVDGHHRYTAAKEIGLTKIDAIIVDLTFEKTKKIRQAESLLKQFDLETNYKYSLSSFMKSYLGYRLNRYYSSAFKKKMFKQGYIWRSLIFLKRLIFGKRAIFKSFNEAHNDHK